MDYRTRGKDDLARPFDKVSEGLRRVDVASREWAGLLAYWLTGRSDALFPGAAAARRRRRLRSGAARSYSVRQPASIPVSIQPLR